MNVKLLPTFYRNIGIAIGVLSILFLAFNQFFSGLLEFNNPLIKWILKDLFLICLLVISFTREKAENDTINILRLEKLKQSVVFGGFVLVVDSIVDLVFYQEETDMKSGYEIMVMILIFYLVTFHFNKNKA